jgi:hypothetical protein
MKIGVLMSSLLGGNEFAVAGLVISPLDASADEVHRISPVQCSVEVKNSCSVHNLLQLKSNERYSAAKAKVVLRRVLP